MLDSAEIVEIEEIIHKERMKNWVLPFLTFFLGVTVTALVGLVLGYNNDKEDYEKKAEKLNSRELVVDFSKSTSKKKQVEEKNVVVNQQQPDSSESNSSVDAMVHDSKEEENVDAGVMVFDEQSAFLPPSLNTKKAPVKSKSVDAEIPKDNEVLSEGIKSNTKKALVKSESVETEALKDEEASRKGIKKALEKLDVERRAIEKLNTGRKEKERAEQLKVAREERRALASQLRKEKRREKREKEYKESLRKKRSKRAAKRANRLRPAILVLGDRNQSTVKNGSQSSQAEEDGSSPYHVPIE